MSGVGGKEGVVGKEEEKEKVLRACDLPAGIQSVARGRWVSRRYCGVPPMVTQGRGGRSRSLRSRFSLGGARGW